MGPTAIVVTAPLEICSTRVVSTLIQGIVCEKDTPTHTHRKYKCLLKPRSAGWDMQDLPEVKSLVRDVEDAGRDLESDHASWQCYSILSITNDLDVCHCLSTLKVWRLTVIGFGSLFAHVCMLLVRTTSKRLTPTSVTGQGCFCLPIDGHGKLAGWQSSPVRAWGQPQCSGNSSMLTSCP